MNLQLDRNKWGTNMFWLYCLPGRWLAQIKYLFPTSYVSSVRTRRQKDSPLAHCITSTIIYIVLLTFLIGSFTTEPSQAGAENSHAASEAEAVQTQPEQPIEEDPVSEEILATGPQTAPEETPAAMHVDEQNESRAPAAVSDADSTINPETSAKLAIAMDEALSTGQPARWKDGDLSGYAVPSAAESTAGCRNIFYTVDQKDGWKSTPRTVCH